MTLIEKLKTMAAGCRLDGEVGMAELLEEALAALPEFGTRLEHELSQAKIGPAEGPTPRTDAEAGPLVLSNDVMVMVEFARQLERELAEERRRHADLYTEWTRGLAPVSASGKPCAWMNDKGFVSVQRGGGYETPLYAAPVSTSGLRAALERLCDLKAMKVALETQSGDKLMLPGGEVLRSDIQRYYDTNKEPAWAEARSALSATQERKP